MLWCVIKKYNKPTDTLSSLLASRESSYHYTFSLYFLKLSMSSSLGIANLYLQGTSSGHCLEACKWEIKLISTVKLTVIVKKYEHNLESEQFCTWIFSEKNVKMMIWKSGEILHLILSGDLVKGVQRSSLQTLV